MKLPPVEYEAPTTVAEAVDLLAEHGDEASVLAGGQSLIPLLALRLARPEVLIDINRVDELSGVSAANGHVTIGAMTREYVAEESEIVGEALPLLTWPRNPRSSARPCRCWRLPCRLSAMKQSAAAAR